LLVGIQCIVSKSLKHVKNEKNALCLIYGRDRKRVALGWLHLWITEDQLSHWLVFWSLYIWNQS